ncbi:SEC-C domain-containing protein [Saccharopolyspora phatthalungensis]|uniref:Tetratricopeptide (TPR) repeat protein n=1 Tax=Saccharopolyspora phatthalungensis TaxID=664693 RepID=A0A840Q5X2_9PSEU|nr:SEC-C domain-containing protein [Saccharopolyspora phatthalungensis]MBB5153785.1 tetratricopeptide (TPR) repeat protein [Saccharopolyspora phatthalungensis]
MAVTFTETQRRLHIEYAEALEADAATSDERSTDLVEASDYWHFAGEHEREERVLLAAIEVDDGNSVLSAPAAYAKFLLTHGRREEAEQRFATLLREGSDCEWAYVTAAIAYQEINEPREALRWLNVGANRFVPDLDIDLRLGDSGYELLRERSILRRELDLPKDRLDDRFDRLAEHGRQISARISEIRRPDLIGQVAVLYWPEEEFTRLQRERPSWYPDTTHLEHRRDVERDLREQPRPVLATGSIEALVDFAASRGKPLDEPSTRAEFAAYTASRGEAADWPPGRNNPCWCGSTRKYKKCCGAPGFA